ncbi:hypothetical protein C8J57DRAFT_1496888 [Mycena rebaudengoi]|nr:hypothetical protein C8J57DRAFT_1496888 [Mycena rebaudengoi]
MSFIANEDSEWASDTWPEGFRFGGDLGAPHPADTQPWMAVPDTLSGMLEWAYVARSGGSPDLTREHMLLYRQPPHAGPNVLCPVGVRVQGFVSRASLGPLGNWDGQRDGAVSAVQVLVLTCHGHTVPWGATMASLGAIRDLVETSLTGRGYSRPIMRRPPRPLAEQDIYMTRRVFEKITPRNRSLRVSALDDGDDPFGRTAAIQDDWMVTKKLSSGKLVQEDEGGSYFVPHDPRAIGEGDFVDVCVGFDIVARRAPRRGEVEFHVKQTLQHVILLRSAADMEPDRAIVDRPTPLVSVIEQGLVF